MVRNGSQNDVKVSLLTSQEKRVKLLSLTLS